VSGTPHSHPATDPISLFLFRVKSACPHLKQILQSVVQSFWFASCSRQSAPSRSPAGAQAPKHMPGAKELGGGVWAHTPSHACAHALVKYAVLAGTRQPSLHADRSHQQTTCTMPTVPDPNEKRGRRSAPDPRIIPELDPMRHVHIART